MRRNLISTCLTASAVMLLTTACSGSGLGDIGGLFDDSCGVCEPTPVAQSPCDPPPADCAPPTAPVVQDQRPPDARPGEVWCYVRVPAVTRTEEERVCVRQASFREVQVPAQTQQVERRVCVQQASQRRIDIPATFEEVPERICVAPARTEWQRVDCNPTQLASNEQVGECWTLREIPPQYQTRMKRVCTRQASCTTETIPAKFETRLETVVVKAACVNRVEVPAAFETRLREVVVCGPRWEWRRTTECEVPEAAAADAPAAPGAGDDNALPAPAPAPAEGAGDPDGDLPPAGGLPPLR